MQRKWTVKKTKDQLRTEIKISKWGVIITLKTMYGSFISISKSSEPLRCLERISIGLIRPSCNLISDLTLLWSKWNCRWKNVSQYITKGREMISWSRKQENNNRNWRFNTWRKGQGKRIQITVQQHTSSSFFSQSWNSARARSLAKIACKNK